MTFDSVAVGTLNLRAKQDPVNPYLSIGGNFFYFDRAHHWSFGGELGVVYTGDPKVDLTRTGGPNTAIDAALAKEQAKVRDRIKDFKYWPVIKLGITFS